MNLPYFMMDDDEVEENIKKAEANVEEMKHHEEEKAEKKWESEILSGLHLTQHGSSSSKGSTKTPGSKQSVASKDKTPGGKTSMAGSSFGSSIKEKKKSTPISASSKAGHDIKKR
jgi:hypothetical protein